MIEINMRKVLIRQHKGLISDYHRLMTVLCLADTQLCIDWNDIEDDRDMQIYQYFSFHPFYLIEVAFTHRMNIGKSVICLRESVESYLSRKRLPRLIKYFLSLYLTKFLNSMDAIVVENEHSASELIREGIQTPHIRVIHPEPEGAARFEEIQWLNFYQSIWNTLVCSSYMPTNC